MVIGVNAGAVYVERVLWVLYPSGTALRTRIPTCARETWICSSRTGVERAGGAGGPFSRSARAKKEVMEGWKGFL